MSRRTFGQTIVARRYRLLTTRLLHCGAALGVILFLAHAARDEHGPVAAAPAGRLVARPSGAAAVPAPPVRVAQQASIASTIEVIVRRNDTLDAIFRRMAFDMSDLAAIRHLPGIRQSLDFLRPGDSIRVTHSSDGAIERLSRKVSETQTLQVTRSDGGFAATLVDDPVETRIRTATATIDSSLFQAAEGADISDTVALKLADVFAWDIDFVLDIREGDRFTAVYNQIYQGGRFLRDGDVLAAEFVNAGRVYRAVRFTAADGTARYYTPEGAPLRKAFLRAPVEFTRISSGFNPRRMHPILNRIRGHMGTDYAAPVGTPVHAAGDGRVNFAGRRGGYGNAILLSHSNHVSTLYGHLSRFARGLRVGSHVSQGQIIGYVGMTGLATGPHLHYEYLSRGVHLNPQTVALPAAQILEGPALAAFRTVAAPLLADLEAPGGPAAAVAAAPGAAPGSAASASEASGGPLARTSVPSALPSPSPSSSSPSSSSSSSSIH